MFNRIGDCVQEWTKPLREADPELNSEQLEARLGKVFRDLLDDDTSLSNNCWSIRSSITKLLCDGVTSRFYGRAVCPHSVEHPTKTVDGSRPGQNKLFTDCPVHLRVVGDPFGSLTVTKVHLDHNHRTGPEYTRFYAKQCQLSAQEKQEIARLLDLKAQPTAIAAAISRETNKVITTKKILNVKQVGHLT